MAVPRPTNKQIVVAPLVADTEKTVRETCAAQGCTCGEHLVVAVTALTPAEAVAREAAGHPSGEQHFDVSITHALSCPLLTRMMGHN